MAARSMWKGSLRIGLVNIPVRMYAATESKAKIDFHQYHSCGARTQNKVWCPVCAKELQREATAPDAVRVLRGYEYAKGSHVLVPDAELDALAEASSHAIDVETVTDDMPNPIYIDGTAYLVPEEGVAQQAFETVRLGLGKRLAIGTVVLQNKTVRVALEAEKHGFIVYKLRPASAVRTLESVSGTPLAIIPPKNDVALAKQLLDNLEGEVDYDDVQDEYTDRLRARLGELVAAKVAGTDAPAMVAAVPKSAPVASLSDLLTASLKAAQAAKLPAKAKAVKAIAADTKKRKHA